jgi:myo-inositol-1(or 4)-monophosphatase
MVEVPLSLLEELERTAVHLARLAGEQITAALERPFNVEFKTAGAGNPGNSNPVSEIDRAVEAKLRAVLGNAFPDHAIVGEETEGNVDPRAQFVWVIDPVDGTTNFVNGLPLFASSIGVLCNSRPIVGAIWCSTSHRLRSGIYHAHDNGALKFDGTKLQRRQAAPWRGLASEPGAGSRMSNFFEMRVLASAAIECSFAAAGLLRVAHLRRPAIWDIAGGIVLARAGGATVMTKVNGEWQAFKDFTTHNDADLRSWRQPVLIGDSGAERHGM